MVSDVTAQNPPAKTVSKKKRKSSEQFKVSYNKKTASKQARPSRKALVPVKPNLPEERFADTGKVYEQDDRLADGENYADLWDEFIAANPEAANPPDPYEEMFEGQTPITKDFKGRTVTKLAGARKDYHRDIIAFDGAPLSRIKVGSNQDVTFSRKSEKKRKASWTAPSKSKQKEPDDIDETIYDATYQNVYSKVPPKDARNLGLPKKDRKPSKLVSEQKDEEPEYIPLGNQKEPTLVSKQKREPDAINAISENKRKIKSEINDLASPSKLLFRDEWLAEAEKKYPTKEEWKRRDLVDDMFEGLQKGVKGALKAGGKVTKAGLTGVGKGFDIVDAAATRFGESTICKNIKDQNEAELGHIKSHSVRAEESIKGTSNRDNKAGMWAGSLVTQRGAKRHKRYTYGDSSYERLENLVIHGFTCRYIKGYRGHIDLQWSYKGTPCEFSDVKRYLTSDEIYKLRKAANGIFKPHLDAG
jgi:hypothetical protein